MNTITIGRNPQNTIVVGAEHTTVSGNHATIEQVGNQLYLTDHSTNGTYINGSLVHNRRVAISPSDRITLSTHYPLPIQQIMQHLSPAAPPSRATARYVPTPQSPAPAPQQVQQYEPHSEAPAPEVEPRNLNSFNWGAFLLSWIWGCGNGIYWPLIIFIPYVGWAAGMVIPFVLGFRGNRMAWEKYNGSAHAFEAKQASWTKGAWIYVICVFSLSFIIGMLMAFAD